MQRSLALLIDALSALDLASTSPFVAGRIWTGGADGRKRGGQRPHTRALPCEDRPQRVASGQIS